MKTYKGLTSDYFIRNKKLDKIHDSNTKRFMKYPLDLFIKVQEDVQSARDDNSELWEYQMNKAYGTYYPIDQIPF